MFKVRFACNYFRVTTSFPHNSIDLPDPLIIVSANTTMTAGEERQLICTVTTVDYLVASAVVTVQWSGGSVDESEVTESITNTNGVTSIKTLTFNPLLTSHGAQYTCTAIIDISSINVMVPNSNSTNIMVQSK